MRIMMAAWCFGISGCAATLGCMDLDDDTRVTIVYCYFGLALLFAGCGAALLPGSVYP